MKISNNKSSLTIRDIYMQSNSQYEWKEYKSIIHFYNKFIMNKLIKEGVTIELPSKLGTLSIKKRKSKSKKIDFKKTQEHGMKIYHDNKHSLGYYGLFIWNKDRPNAIFKNKKFYKFYPTRTNKRCLSNCIKYRNTIEKYEEY